MYIESENNGNEHEEKFSVNIWSKYIIFHSHFPDMYNV